MNRKITSLLLTNFLLVTVVACTDARTSADAPNPNSNPTSGSTSSQNTQSTSSPSASPQNTQAAANDAQDETRKRQLESDIRAREQRTGDSTNRPDTDLASEVRSKLEGNIPKGNLTIESKDANIVVSGTVPSMAELDKIKALAMEIKGVKTVTIKAVATSQNN
ncbi:BON domain-containing protein [Pseudanabaena sp. FACHB-1998]|uniref:BON domain-containing protein n=1 Tax=Pseudanabaena sp. FACHB-1998 TaxID=2692858 RepID=UPI00168196E7|nr:BON domain-containing protein [Pseudanabaena sp. FACHB-1998]MBD2178624.1 BON domain-containing protein [Pseudanabaena sp. FACHB-1998]